MKRAANEFMQLVLMVLMFAIVGAAFIGLVVVVHDALKGLDVVEQQQIIEDLSGGHF